MAPYIHPTGVLTETDEIFPEKNVESKKKWKYELHWFNIIYLSFVHVCGIYGFYLLFSCNWQTLLFTYFTYLYSGMGITAAVHRLWAHRTYKARWPLKVLLMTCNTMASQMSVIRWAKDHRVHHKFTETDADPHNIKNGFFFSHVGWLLVKRQPEYFEKARKLDISDLLAEPILRFQHKYYPILMLIFCFVIPTYVPMYYWGETFRNSLFVPGFFRYVVVLHASWLIGSYAHYFGNKPFDKNIRATENLWISVYALGEGWHNFHHIFPWDYKTGELGSYGGNFTTAFIDFCAKIGLAYDLKTVSKEMIEKRVKQSGDGSHAVWGTEDKDFENYLK